MHRRNWNWPIPWRMAWNTSVLGSVLACVWMNLAHVSRFFGPPVWIWSPKWPNSAQGACCGPESPEPWGPHPPRRWRYGPIAKPRAGASPSKTPTTTLPGLAWRPWPPSWAGPRACIPTPWTKPWPCQPIIRPVLPVTPNCICNAIAVSVLGWILLGDLFCWNNGPKPWYDRPWIESKKLRRPEV